MTLEWVVAEKQDEESKQEILWGLISECGAEVKDFRRPFRPRPAIEAFSRRENHQFALVVIFVLKFKIGGVLWVGVQF